MNTTEKFWFVLAGAILGMAIIACSCGEIMPTPTITIMPIIEEDQQGPCHFGASGNSISGWYWLRDNAYVASGQWD